MWTSEKEVAVLQVQKGMYISRLDRPWKGTCFPLQGFLVKTDEDIEKLCLYCEIVYIDVYKSHTEQDHQLTQNKNKGKDAAHELGHSPKQRKDRLEYLTVEKYPVINSFKRETTLAYPILKKIESELERLLIEDKTLNSLSLQRILNCTSDIVESVIRNPDAMVWLCQIRRNNSLVFQHAVSLAILSCIVGRQFGLNRFLLVELTMAMLMTCVGKSLIKQHVLEQVRHNHHSDTYKNHIRFSLDKLGQHQLANKNIRSIIENYCERADGSGYPKGKLKGDIPLLAQIAGLIDSFNQQVNPFNHQFAVSPSHAVSHLNQIKGRLFDAKLVEKFVQAVGIYPTGTLVELNDDRIGIVCSQRYEKRLRASVIPLTTRKGNKVERFQVLDLNMPNQWQLSDSHLRIRQGLAINHLPQQLVDDAHQWMFKKNIGTWGKLKNRVSAF